MEGILPGDNEPEEVMKRLRKQGPKVEVENPFETGLKISVHYTIFPVLS